nr:helix-turn-helix domain-containing protein [Terrabacter sp. MAHUQ-38]
MRRFREAAGWTQEELAERAGLTSHGISALERGLRSRPYPHTVRSLATALALGQEDRQTLMAAVPPRHRTPHTADVTGIVATGSGALAAAGVGSSARGLPADLTPLVGRSGDVAAVLGLLRSPGVRLVTLTGTGGVGKTRLATAVARAARHDHSGGVAVVHLAAVEDEALILPTIGRALGLHAVEGSDETVLTALRRRDLLLLLDNLEQLRAAGVVVARLLEECDGVRVLATSRAALRVRGESEYAVQPLALPTGREGMPEVEAAPASRLLLSRARAVAPGFASSPDDARAVAALSRRLAGIPLAIELAAARARLLSPLLLLDRLDDALDREGAADLPERQRTMRATLDWSYRLLGEPERALYRRLAVFTGGASIDAVEQVAGDLGDALTLLERLVEHSLVRVTTLADGTVRHSVLEPVHQHAASLLEPAEGRLARAWHAEVYRARAHEAAPSYEGAEQVVWLDRSERDAGNLAAAVDHFLAQGDGERAGQMVWDLWLFWWLRGHLRQGRRLAEAAITLGMTAPTRVRATLTAASMAFAQGDIDASARRWAEARRIASDSGDRLGQAFAEAGEGLAALASGQVATAQSHFLRVVDAVDHDDPAADWILGLTQVWLGTVHLLRDEPQAAVERCEQGLSLARRRGDRLTTYVALYGLVQAALALGQQEEARELLVEGIELSDETGDLANLSFFLESLAVVEGSRGRHVRAARLLGASTAMRDRVGSAVYGYYLPDPALRTATEQEARGSLGPDALAAELAHGRSLTADEAVALAVGDRHDTATERTG